MAVIGFTTYLDFIDEINSVIPCFQPVRVQSYQKLESIHNGMAQSRTFFVELSTQVIRADGVVDVLVCRFITGQPTIFSNHDPDQLAEFVTRNHIVTMNFRRDLANREYRVAGGLIAAAADSHTQATLDPIWTIDPNQEHD